MKHLLLLAILSFYSFIASAETLSSKTKAKEFAHDVMTEIGKGNMETGVKLTKPYLIVPEHEFLALLDQMKMQQPAINQRFGKTLNVELAAVEEVGESLMLVMYLQKFENHVLRWKFYFYKPRNSWVLNTFTFDDQLQAMFQLQ